MTNVRKHTRTNPVTGAPVEVSEHARAGAPSRGTGVDAAQFARVRASADASVPSLASPSGGRALSPAEAATLRALRYRVEAGTMRVAALGGWQHRASPTSLLDRLPEVDDAGETAVMGRGGFDAGVACAADLIPRPRQRLAAVLHAAYTPEAVAQARREAVEMAPDSETTWWLAACSTCEEGPADARTVVDQVARFQELATDPARRVEAARSQHRDMLAAFELRDGVPYALRDGGMQGAYLAGHGLAVQHAESYGLWFVGTNRPTLGLEGFAWAEPGDPAGATPEARSGRSGPVGGSSQFVKCRDEDELRRVLAAARPAG